MSSSISEAFFALLDGLLQSELVLYSIGGVLKSGGEVLDQV